MGQQHRLGTLQMGVTRDSYVLVGFSQGNKGVLQPTDALNCPGDGIPREEAQIKGYLVVPGTRGVQLAADITNLLDEAGFDIHVNIFKLRLELKHTLLDFFLD